MYLNRKHYVENWSHQTDDNQVHINIKTKTGLPLPAIINKNITYIIEEAMYWRKANAIHNWFVNNVQAGIDDCGTYTVTEEQIQELIDVCDYELKHQNNSGGSNKGLGLTPTIGFFFGSTEKDEYFYDEIKETKDTLTKLLELDKLSLKYTPDYTYRSSW